MKLADLLAFDFSNFNVKKLTTASLLSAVLVGGVVYQASNNKDAAGKGAITALLLSGGATAIDPRKKSGFPAVSKREKVRP